MSKLRRTTPRRIRHLLEKWKFEIVHNRKLVNDIRVLFQIYNLYVDKTARSRWKILIAIRTLLLVAPANILGEIIGWIFPRNDDLYIGNVVLARKRQA